MRDSEARVARGPLIARSVALLRPHVPRRYCSAPDQMPKRIYGLQSLSRLTTCTANPKRPWCRHTLGAAEVPFRPGASMQPLPNGSRGPCSTVKVPYAPWYACFCHLHAPLAPRKCPTACSGNRFGNLQSPYQVHVTLQGQGKQLCATHPLHTVYYVQCTSYACSARDTQH